MKRVVFALVFFLLFLVIQPGLHSGALSGAKETWLGVRSKNFQLIGNASEKDIRKVGVRLEQFRDVFTRIFTKSKANSAIPITVIVFKDDTAFKPYKPLYQGKPAAVSGYFMSGQDINYITLTSDFRQVNPYAVIFHEYVHALTSDNSRPLPPWVSEGIAEYYSSFEVEHTEKKVWLGKAIANHVLSLREQKFLPLERLFAVDHNSPEYNERERKGVFYAQSWALVHYLSLGNNGKWNAQFRQFINALALGHPVNDSFIKIFQTDYATLEKELRDYIGRSSYPAQFVTFDEKLSFDAGMQTTTLSEAEVQYYLGDLLCRIQRREEGEELLKRAVSLDPKLAAAYAALGMIQVRQNRFAEARKYLEQAVAANSQNHLAHYYYGYALYRELFGDNRLVSNLPSERVKQIRAALDKTIQLAPDFPETYNLLAFLHLATGENLATGVNAVKRAMAIAPGREEYGFTLAQLYMRQENFAEARGTLALLARSASNPELRSNASSLLETIAQIEQFKARQAEAGIVESTRPSNRVNPADATSPPAPLPGHRFEGEKLKGMLTRVDCDTKGMTLTIQTDDKIVKLNTSTPERVQFITYVKDVHREITCGPINPARGVIVTYRSTTDAKSKFAGEPLAVEFVGKQ